MKSQICQSNKLNIIKSLLMWAEEKLIKNNIEDAHLSAEWLLSDILAVSKVELVLNKNLVVTDENIKDFYIKVTKRSQGIPLQYISNTVNFYDFSLYVNENVLVPRPETEQLCELSIKYISDNFNLKEKINILEIGIGSGAISIALAKNLKNIFILGTDVSLEAIKIAEKNIKNNNLEDKICVKNADLFCKTDIKFDVIISNPPYIKTDDLQSLPREVQFEPLVALDGGEDGLFFYDKIMKQAKFYLKDKGIIIFEISDEVCCSLKQLAEKYNFKIIKAVKDYNKHERFLLLQNK
jgi:release factor glutamine methyltransferase